MDTEAACEILDDVFQDPVTASTPTWSAEVRLWFSAGFEDEPARAIMAIYQDDALILQAEQPVALLPGDREITPERYRAFALGVRAGMGFQIARYEGMTGPAEVFLSDLLRDPTLQTAADFARAVEDDDVQRRVLAPIQVGDLGDAQGLPPITDTTTCQLVWDLLREQAHAESSAQRLADEARIEAAPHLIALVEHWVDRGYFYQGHWFVGGENAHRACARALEPLLRQAAGLAERVDALAEAGCFEAL